MTLNRKNAAFVLAVVLLWLVSRLWMINAKNQYSNDGAFATVGAAGNLPLVTMLLRSEGAVLDNGIIKASTWNRRLFDVNNNGLKDVYLGQKQFDIHPPLYFYLLHLCYKTIGVGPKQALFLNVVLELFFLMCFVGLLKSLGLSFKQIIICAPFVILLPPTIGAFCVARPYVLFGALALALTTYFHKVITKKKFGALDKFLFGLIVALGLLTHFQFSLLVFSFFVYIVFLVFSKKISFSAVLSIWPSVVVAVFVCEILFPGYFYGFISASIKVEGWQSMISLNGVLSYIQAVIVPNALSKSLGMALSAILALALIAILVKGHTKADNKLGVLLIPSAISFVLFLVLYLQNKVPSHTVFNGRNFVIYVVPFTVLLITSVNYSKAWQGLLLMIYIGVLLVSLFVTNKSHIDTETPQTFVFVQPRVGQLATYLYELNNDKDVLVINNRISHRELDSILTELNNYQIQFHKNSQNFYQETIDSLNNLEFAAQGFYMGTYIRVGCKLLSQ